MVRSVRIRESEYDRLCKAAKDADKMIASEFKKPSGDKTSLLLNINYGYVPGTNDIRSSGYERNLKDLLPYLLFLLETNSIQTDDDSNDLGKTKALIRSITNRYVIVYPDEDEDAIIACSKEEWKMKTDEEKESLFDPIFCMYSTFSEFLSELKPYPYMGGTKKIPAWAIEELRRLWNIYDNMYQETAIRI